MHMDLETWYKGGPSKIDNKFAALIVRLAEEDPRSSKLADIIFSDFGEGFSMLDLFVS